MKQLLSGRDIIKTYGTGEERHRALDGVSVEIEEGEFVSVMGPSGSGKSTLLYALSGMDPTDGGQVMFEGRNLSGLSDGSLSDLRRTRMGFVFQQPALLRNLNLLDNIILPAARDHRRERKRLEEKASSLMEQMGIEGLEQREITQVSGGQLQRAGICRALMSGPKIIFGDEPTGALNSRAAGEVMELFGRINAGGTAILLVTHDAAVAARTRRVLFMRDGTIVSEMKLPQYDPEDHDRRVEKIMGKMRSMGI